MDFVHGYSLTIGCAHTNSVLAPYKDCDHNNAAPSEQGYLTWLYLLTVIISQV